jgi:predicted nucleic acid-binding protein
VPIYVSAVTELELFAYSDLSAEEESLIEGLLATVSVIPLDSRIARLAALVRRDYRLKVPDSVIAATVMFTGSKLLTRNTRDFRKIPNFIVFKILHAKSKDLRCSRRREKPCIEPALMIRRSARRRVFVASPADEN